MEKIFSQNQTKEIAQKIIKKIAKINLEIATVISLSGELGSGKTTLTQEIGKQLGVKKILISPTFVIIKKYKTKNKKFKNLIHIDAYRLNSSNELTKLDWQKLVENKENLIIIEWPEKVPKCLKNSNLKVFLEHKDKNTRKIKILI